MIERIKSIREAYGVNGLMVSYLLDSVLIMISSDVNLFEPVDMDVPATESLSLLTIQYEFRQVLSLIDQMEQYDRGAAYRAV